MATWLKNTILFANIPVGVTALPHRLVSPSGVPLIPDLVAANTVSPAGALFSVTADATNVIVTNGSGGDITVTIYVESWHTIERTFGSDNTLALVPQPFVIGNNGSGGGGGPGPAVVAPPPTDIASVLGVSLLYARQDHTHETGLAVAVNGGAPSPNRAHTLNLTGTAITGLVSAAGVATYTIDAGAFVGAGVPTQIQNVAASAGVSVLAARADHVHNVSFANVLATGTANAAGVATSLALSDHVHQTNVLVVDEVTPQGGAHTFTFVGAGVTAAVAANVATITIPGAGGAVDLQTAYNNGAAGIQAIQESVANLGISIRDIPAGTNNPIFAVTDSGGGTADPYLHVRAYNATTNATTSLLATGSALFQNPTAGAAGTTPNPILRVNANDYAGPLTAFPGIVQFDFSCNLTYPAGFTTSAAFFTIATPTLLGTGASTMGYASVLEIAGGPANGAAMTVTNRWAITTNGGLSGSGGVAGATTWTAHNGGISSLGQLIVSSTTQPNNNFNEDQIIVFGDAYQASIAARVLSTGLTADLARFITRTVGNDAAVKQLEMISGGNGQATSSFDSVVTPAGYADSATVRLISSVAQLLVGVQGAGQVVIGSDDAEVLRIGSAADTGFAVLTSRGTEQCFFQFQTDDNTTQMLNGGSTTAGSLFGIARSTSFVLQPSTATNVLLGAGTGSTFAAGVGTTLSYILESTGAHLQMRTRLQGAMGADVASATNMTLGNDGNHFNITGTTQVDTIVVTNWQAGSVITLRATNAAGFSFGNNAGGAGSISVPAGAVFAMPQFAVATLVYDGTNWRMTSVSLNNS